MKTILFLLFLWLSSTSIKAQQNTVAAFGNATGSGGSVSFTVGQIGFTSLTNTTNAGVQQSFDNSISLPVTGLLLNATKQGKEVLLKWETIAEINSSYFIIQRSAGGNAFADSIGMVTAKGNSSSLSKYSLIDKLPAKGMNYYRLKQVDKDGKFIYSATVAVNIDANIIVSCYPNPTSSIIKLDIGTIETNGYSYQLFDMNGKLLQTASLAQTLTLINMEALKAASYIIKVFNKEHEVTSVVVLKK
ncbi:MAG: T9SS type A sorting domain-containing protein [Chitinophagaceae bacterium]|nr:T9SS type A sorting domain-containing protein [Chitinophagaceae bacterium]